MEKKTGCQGVKKERKLAKKIPKEKERNFFWIMNSFRKIPLVDPYQDQIKTTVQSREILFLKGF
jgi:hypothetical protein